MLLLGFLLTKADVEKMLHHVTREILSIYLILFYYMGTGVLLENTPLVKFTRNCIRDLSGVFSTSSLVRISITSFPAFSRLFVFGWVVVYIIKRTLHVSSGDINFMFSWQEVLPLEHKIHIFSPPYHILYIFKN